MNSPTGRALRILHVVNGLAIGGAERKVLDLSRRLREVGFEPGVCSVGQGGPLLIEFEKLGIPVWIFPKKFAFDVSLITKVAGLIQTWRPDIVQTTLLYADVIGALAARSVGFDRVVSWETVSHGENDILRTRIHHGPLYRIAMKGVRRIVAVSEEIRRSLIERRKIPSNKIVLIPYGVDVEKFQPAGDKENLRTELGLPKEGILFGTVARLEPYKGYPSLLKAAKRVAAKYPDVHFVWVGDGSLRPRLESEIRKLSLESRIRLLGFRNDVDRLLPAFDVFILPSLSEGLPNAVLEAMACGLPCIVTRVGGIPEVVHDFKTGLLVPPDDPDGISRAIEYFVGNPDARKEIGQRARNLVVERYSVQREVRAFAELYWRLALN